MKNKLFAVLLCLVVAFSATSLVACGGNDNEYFNGDYQASSQEEVTTFSQTIADNTSATSIDWYKGYSIDFTLSGNMGGGDVTVDMDYKVGVKDDELAAAGNIELTDVAMNISGGIYYLDGYNYINGSVGAVGGTSVSGKYKQSMSYEEFMEEYGLDSVLIENLGDVLPYLAMYDEVNYFVDNGEETIKVKIEMPNQTITQEYEGVTQTSTGSGTYVFVYDTEYNLIGFYADMTSNSTFTSPSGSGQTTMSATLSITPYEGAIELPSDLDTYLLGE
ncbi:MAG: hypothetical protein IJX16_02015 [Clostridia bacterium]|nr:hypothetical protein [Clostridia bacterium]